MRLINCKYATEFGKCTKKPRVSFGLLKQQCVENGYYEVGICDIAVRHPRPTKIPPPPPPRNVTGKTFETEVCTECMMINPSHHSYCSYCGTKLNDND